MEEFDIIVIGGGTAGTAAAQSAVEQGVRVGLIESGRIGGHSLLRGQLALEVVHDRLKNSGQPGSFESLVREVDDRSAQISEEIEANLTSAGVTCLKGEGALAGNRQVTLQQGADSSIIKTGKVIIATGSLPKPVSSIPFDNQSIVHIDRLLDWKETPSSLLIVGGDKASLEAAYLFNLLGTKVFLVDEHNRLIHDKDPDLITALELGFKKQKIKTLLGKKIISIYKGAGKVDITLDGGVKFSTEKVLVSGARLGNTSPLGLGDLSMEQGANQEIWVNEYMETSIKGVFAAGSVTGRPRSRQISMEEGRIAGINAAGGKEPLDRDQIPFCLQMHPEIASIGCLGGDAHYRGYRAVVGRYDSPGNDETSNSGGNFCKVVADRESKRIIGAQILGGQALESIAQVQSNIRETAPVENLAQISDPPASLKPIIKAAKECLRALSARR